MKQGVKASRQTIIAGISLYALMTAQSALAQSCDPGPVCEIDNSGSIGPVTGTAGTATIVTNSGTITGATAIDQNQASALFVDNQASGIVDGDIRGVSLLSFGVRNAGQIEGSVRLNDDSGPYLFTGGTIYYIADGGEVSGNVELGTNGFTTANFIQRGMDSGVDNVISAGLGLDTYTKSYSSSQSLALGQYALPTSFEMEGYEALGSGTTVTLTGSGTSITVMGDGNIVNDGTIGLVDPSGVYPMGVDIVPAAVNYYSFFVHPYRRDQIPLGNPGSFYGIGYGDALTSFTNNGTINGDVRLHTAAFTNNGDINLSSHANGSVIYSAADQAFLFRNSGDIVMSDDGARPVGAAPAAEFEYGTDHAIRISTAIDSTVPASVTIENLATGTISGGLAVSGFASDFTFDNAGLISIGDNPVDIDRAVEIDMIEFFVARNPDLHEDVVGNSATLTNSGTLDGGIEAGFTTRALSFTNSASGHINADSTDPYAAAVELSTNDWPSVSGGEDINDAETFDFLNQGTIVGTVELEADATLVDFTNDSSITQAFRPGHLLYVDDDAADTVSIVQNTTLGAETTFANTGTISNADYGGGAVYIELEAGDISSGVPEASMAEAVVSVSNSGTISASGGNYVTPGGYDNIPANQALVDFAFALNVTADGEAASRVTVDNLSGGLIEAQGQAQIGSPTGPTSLAGATATGLALTVFADEVTITNAGTIRGGALGSTTPPSGVTLVPIVSDGRNFEDVIGGAIDTFGGTDDVTNSATGVIEGGVALRSGDDIFRNYGNMTGDLDLGAGDDRFIQRINAIFTGNADGGTGSDTFVLDITGGGTIDGSIYDRLFNFEILTTMGSGTVDIDGTEEADTLSNEGELDGDVTLGGGEDDFTQSGIVTGNVDLGTGNDIFTNSGTVNGNIDMGEGDDTLLLTGDWSVGGTVDGGDGDDSVGMTVAGPMATQLDLTQFSAFETFDFNGGTGYIGNAGNAGFDQININDGYLYGLAGSTFTGDVAVSEGATFGSAGTVNGNVDVSGTLSPGASPGTLIINGDLLLDATSLTLFEMTPTVSDAIVINGALDISSGATLQLTGDRPLTPGVAYDLITASGGITGRFDADDIIKAATVFGFVSQSDDAIQLLGTFMLNGGASDQSQLTVDYLNALLIGGAAPTGVMAAIPLLVDGGGFADESALATVSPEPYASTVQMGIENGLAISAALRSASLPDMPEKGGLFVFGEAFGSHRNFDRDNDDGVAKADIRNYGAFGGVGFGGENFAVAAFVGQSDSRQKLGQIGAHNDADGLFAGAMGRYQAGGLRAGASLIWDRGNADTQRSLFNGDDVQSHYRLRGLTIDGFVGYGFDIGGGWQFGPEVGVTHVSVKRGDIEESGNAFALEIESQRYDATFLSGDLTLTRSTVDGWRPYLSAGIRHMVDGDPIRATGSFLGTAGSFTVRGVERNETLANVGAGIEVDVTPALTIYARGNSEFGADNNGRSINGGIRFAF